LMNQNKQLYGKETPSITLHGRVRDCVSVVQFSTKTQVHPQSLWGIKSEEDSDSEMWGMWGKRDTASGLRLTCLTELQGERRKEKQHSK